MEVLLVSALPEGASPEEQEAYVKAFRIICGGTGTLGSQTATFTVYEKPETDITVGLMEISPCPAPAMTETGIQGLF